MSTGKKPPSGVLPNASPSAHGANQNKKRASRREPAPPPQNVESEPPLIPPASPPEIPKPPPDDDLAGIPQMPQEMIDAWHDDHDDDDKPGYKKTPKHSRYKKGQSGNPSGKRKKRATPPGNTLQNIGHEVVDEMTEILLGQVTDLQINPNDRVTTAFAKVVVSDGIKKDGAFRKFVLSQFLEKPLQSERLAPVDPSEEEARIMGKIINAIVDPAMTEDQLNEVMQEAAQHHETYGEFGARRRKERKKRRKPRRKR